MVASPTTTYTISTPATRTCEPEVRPKVELQAMVPFSKDGQCTSGKLVAGVSEHCPALSIYLRSAVFLRCHSILSAEALTGWVPLLDGSSQLAVAAATDARRVNTAHACRIALMRSGVKHNVDPTAYVNNSQHVSHSKDARSMQRERNSCKYRNCRGPLLCRAVKMRYDNSGAVPAQPTFDTVSFVDEDQSLDASGQVCSGVQVVPRVG